MHKQETENERRSSTPSLISNMLDERQQLFTLLLQVYKIEPLNTPESDMDLLNEFCQVLVDYIAAGHFGLYERIIEGRERRKKVAAIAMKIYPKIEDTTQLALRFNEKYAPDKAARDFSEIQQDLSRLGEELTSRIELEDRLLKELI